MKTNFFGQDLDDTLHRTALNDYCTASSYYYGHMAGNVCIFYRHPALNKYRHMRGEDSVLIQDRRFETKILFFACNDKFGMTSYLPPSQSLSVRPSVIRGYCYLFWVIFCLFFFLVAQKEKKYNVFHSHRGHNHVYTSISCPGTKQTASHKEENKK